MRWAKDEKGKRIEATKGAVAYCPSCNAQLKGKAGNIITTPYWSHRGGDCDPWSERETDWHANWKKLFPEDQQEYDEGEHRADIKTSRCVIELQHSFIPVEEIWEREIYYDTMFWIFDCREAYKTGRITIGNIPYDRKIYWNPDRMLANPKEFHVKWNDVLGDYSLKMIKWSHRKKTILECRKPILLHFEKGKLFNTYYWGHKDSTAANCGLGHFITKDKFFEEVETDFNTSKSTIFSLDHVPMTESEYRFELEAMREKEREKFDWRNPIIPEVGDPF